MTLLGSYERLPVEPENLTAFFNSLRHGNYVGCNVTLPHKQAAAILVDEPDERVRRIGALNTVWKVGAKLCGTSTDGPGYVANLKSEFPDFSIAGAHIVVLGAGGSARSVIDELLRERARTIAVFNRTHSKAHELSHLFGKAVAVTDAQDLPQQLSKTQLLINTTSAGVSDQQQLELPWSSLNTSAVVSDLSYVPLVTPFLKQAQQRQHPVLTGLGMLLHQAVFGFERWFGKRPVVTRELYNLVARDIDPDFAP